MFAWILAAFCVCLGNTVIRAQSFAYLFFALALWLIVEDSRAPRLRTRTWLVVPVLVLWANTHGTVLLGAALAAAYAACRAVAAWTRAGGQGAAAYGTLGLVAAATPACTPYGAGVVRYYGSLVANPVLTHYSGEWAPPALTNPLSWAFFGLTAVTVIAVGFARRPGARPDPLLSWLTGALLALALTGERFQVWFAFAAALLAADTLAQVGTGRSAVFGQAFRRATAGTLATLALACLAAIAATPASQFESLVPGRAISVAAAISARNPAMRILADDWSGAPMLWLHPETSGRVGFDIRVEQYSRAEARSYFDFLDMQGPNWRQVMGRYALIVVSHEHPSLASALRATPGWRAAYQDQSGIVFERQPRR